MRRFTIETTYRLPIFRHRTYEAKDLDHACRLALEDEDWTDQKEDYETHRPVHVTGIWPDADTAYKAAAIPVPAAFADESSPSSQSPSVSARVSQIPIMTAADATSIGFATFNRVPTLPIDIPGGGFTISAKTSEGRRVTFFFGPNRTGGPARFIDIQYHDAGMTVPDGGGAPAPVFDLLAIAVILLDQPGDMD